MNEHEAEEGFVDIWFHCVGLLIQWWGPGRIGNSIADYALEDLHCWASVGLEKSGVNLAKNIADGLSFVGEFDGKGIFKLCC